MKDCFYSFRISEPWYRCLKPAHTIIHQWIEWRGVVKKKKTKTTRKKKKKQHKNNKS